MTAFLDKYRRALSLIIPLTAFLVYVSALNNPFAFDDFGFILGKNFYQDIGNIPLLFSKQYHVMTGELTYRPLSVLSFFFSYSVFKMNPAGWRLFNVSLHALNGVLVYILIRTLSPKSNWAALAGGLVFAVHPIFSETINVVGFNDDIQGSTFFLVSLILYVKVVRGAIPKTGLLLSVACYPLALLSKESTVILPAVIFLHDLTQGRHDWKSMVKRQAPYWLITIPFLIAFFTVFKSPFLIEKQWGYLGGSLYTGVINVPRLLILYVGFLVAPFNLTVLHSYSAWQSLNVPAIGAFLGLAGVLYYGFSLYRGGHDGEFLGLAIFLIGLAPVLNLIPLGIPIAERYVYLPSSGAIIFAVLGIERLTLRASTVAARWGTGGAVVLALVVFSTITVQRGQVFNSEISLWKDVVAKAPREAMAQNNLGTAYIHSGMTAEASAAFRRAIELDDTWVAAYVNLGLTIENAGDVKEAKKLYLRANALDPNNPYANNALGGIYNREGRPDLAIRHLRRSLSREPANAQMHLNLGRSYELKGMLTEALNHYRTAAELRPDMPAATEDYNRLSTQTGD